MRESPRIRRLRTDLKAMESLRMDSSILDFQAFGNPPERYIVRFFGRGVWRPDGSTTVTIREQHEVSIDLGAAYPRMMPELSWKTPIFHPNISGSGVVCLGGYGTYWVPSLNLDELCEMLWDMIRYRNFDTESPYNREAALWAKAQSRSAFPVDPRPIRDRLRTGTQAAPSASARSRPATPGATADDELILLDDVIDAEVIEASDDQDILFLD